MTISEMTNNNNNSSSIRKETICCACGLVTTPPKSDGDKYANLSGLAKITIDFPKHKKWMPAKFLLCNECTWVILGTIKQLQKENFRERQREWLRHLTSS